MKKRSRKIGESVKIAGRSLRFVCREPRSAGLMLRMAFWVAALSLGVRVFSLQLVLRALTPFVRRGGRRAPRVSQEEVARLLDLLLSANFWVFTPTCWKRAPVLYRFLLLRGIETRVVFGVKKGGEKLLEGHAWLESEGMPLLEKSPPVYAVTFAYPT